MNERPTNGPIHVVDQYYFPELNPERKGNLWKNTNKTSPRFDKSRAKSIAKGNKKKPQPKKDYKVKTVDELNHILKGMSNIKPGFAMDKYYRKEENMDGS